MKTAGGKLIIVAKWQAVKAWVATWANHRYAARFLMMMCFLEAFISPISPLLLLGPMCFANQKRAYRLVWQATIAATVGALVGYWLGFWLYQQILPIFSELGYAAGFAKAQGWLQQWGVLALLVASIFPLPFKLFAVAAGAAKINLLIFALTTVIVRWLHFMLVPLGMKLVLGYNRSKLTK